MYRVVYWFNGSQRFTAKTPKEDAVNTAKHFNGIVVKEVKNYRDYGLRPKSFRKQTIKDMQEANAVYKERNEVK